MISQTITLIRFFLLNYRQRKNLILLMMIVFIGVVASQFVSELSLISSVEAGLSFQIEFYRYGLVMLSSLILVVAVADDFNSGQFENLLSMPIARWQYIVSQIGAIAILNLIIAGFAGLTMLLQFDIQTSLIWFSSMWLELMLCSFLALLAILSLEKIPNAMILFISLYVLSRSSPIIIEIVEQSIYYSDGATINKIILLMFQAITFVLPNTSVFIQNDLFYELKIDEIALWDQFIWVIIYGGFITTVMLFDFYRKEFVLNRS